MAEVGHRIGRRGIGLEVETIPNLLQVAQKHADSPAPGHSMNVARRKPALSIMLVGFGVLAVVVALENVCCPLSIVTGLVLCLIVGFLLLIQMAVEGSLLIADLNEALPDQEAKLFQIRIIGYLLALLRCTCRAKAREGPELA